MQHVRATRGPAVAIDVASHYRHGRFHPLVGGAVARETAKPVEAGHRVDAALLRSVARAAGTLRALDRRHCPRLDRGRIGPEGRRARGRCGSSRAGAFHGAAFRSAPVCVRNGNGGASRAGSPARARG